MTNGYMYGAAQAANAAAAAQADHRRAMAQAAARRQARERGALDALERAVLEDR